MRDAVTDRWREISRCLKMLEKAKEALSSYKRIRDTDSRFVAGEEMDVFLQLDTVLSTVQLIAGSLYAERERRNQAIYNYDSEHLCRAEFRRGRVSQSVVLLTPDDECDIPYMTPVIYDCLCSLIRGEPEECLAPFDVYVQGKNITIKGKNEELS